MLPECGHFVDVFGGSGCVILNRKENQQKQCTYNDLDKKVVNFFYVLREYPSLLVRKLEFTPYSRFEHDIISKEETFDNIENARRFFINICQSNYAVYGNTWAYSVTCSRGLNKSKMVSQWLGKINRLLEVANKLKKVQIEQQCALKIIKRYDRTDTFFYLDPPYPLCDRTGGEAYCHELTDNFHVKLSQVLENIKGRFAISGYEGLYTNIFKNFNLYKDKERFIGNKKAGKRQECLWTNYQVKQ